MSADAQHVPPTLPEPTDARFSMRAVLIVMTVVAILASLGRFYLRHLTADQQSRIVRLWIIWLLAVVGWTVAMFWLRARAEKLAGATLVKLPLGQHPARDSSVLMILYALFALLFLGCLSATTTLLTFAGGGFEFTMSNGILFLASVYFAASMLPSLLWQRDVRLSENGVLWHQRMLPWNQLRRHQWTGVNASKLQLYGVDTHNKHPMVTTVVAPEVREQVVRILENAAQHAGTTRSASFPEGIDSVSVSRILQTRHTRRQLRYMLASLTAGIGLLAYPWLYPFGLPEFEFAILFGMYLNLAWLVWTRRRTARLGGSPLVGLFARRDWYGLVAIVGAALMLYESTNRTVLPAWLLYPLEVAYGFLVFRAFSYYYFTQLELRSNGVVLLGILFWPWAAVRTVTSGDEKAEYRLVIRHHLRRIIATVPPEQREAVEKVLKEKFPTTCE